MTHLRHIVVTGILFFSYSALGMLEVSRIPRHPGKTFREEALFEGGREQKANLEALRLAVHSRDGFERWVVDFSDEKKRTLGGIAPKFQLQYLPAERVLTETGVEVTQKPAKFIFVFRNIRKNHLTRDKVKSLAKKSRHVREIRLYPPIEGGDMAMEFILKDDVTYEPHQPVEKEGRLVLDIRKRG